MKAQFSEAESQAIQTCRNSLMVVAEAMGEDKKLGRQCIELIAALQKKRIYLIAVDRQKYEAMTRKKEG